MIPKQFFYVWFGSELPSQREIECRRSVNRMHPDWETIFVGDNAAPAFDVGEFDFLTSLKSLWANERLRELGHNYECFLDRILTAYKGRHDKRAIAADFVRVCALYAYGGIALDWDIYALKPFDRFASDDLLFARIRESLVSEGVVGADAGNSHVRAIIDRYVNTQSPESGNCYLNLSSYVDDHNLEAYDAEWFIPHQRNDDPSKRYLVTENTHSIHLWREHEYQFAELEKLRAEAPAPTKKPQAQVRKPCGCTRTKGN